MLGEKIVKWKKEPKELKYGKYTVANPFLTLTEEKMEFLAGLFFGIILGIAGSSLMNNWEKQ
jgi:hypothetical protein